jgi:hypothetical protein
VEAQVVALGVLEPGRLVRAEHADVIDRQLVHVHTRRLGPIDASRLAAAFPDAYTPQQTLAVSRRPRLRGNQG